MRRSRVILRVAIGCLIQAACLCSYAVAQGRPRPAVEGTAGWAGFLDDARIDHAVGGGSVRFYLSPRLGVGPEVVYMIGPGSDRDLTLTGNLTFDLLRPPVSRRRSATPYLVVGGGLFRHSDRFGATTFTSTEGAFTGGGGARVFVTDAVYLGPEVRIGWELHLRIAMTVGVRVGN